MGKRVLLAGILGAIVFLVWTFVTSAIFGFNARVKMNQIPNERVVYSVLKENVVAPGVYVVNPEATPEAGFPFGEPVYAVSYAGFGHEAAGRLFFMQPAIALVASILVAWLLSMTSRRVLSSYSRKVLFVVVIGVFFAVLGDLTKFEIGGYPAKSALLLAVYDVISWTLAGLVIARVMRAPAEVEQAA
jgi:hypothetical protein